jgi:hypothetical protein
MFSTFCEVNQNWIKLSREHLEVIGTYVAEGKIIQKKKLYDNFVVISDFFGNLVCDGSRTPDFCSEVLITKAHLIHCLKKLDVNIIVI